MTFNFVQMLNREYLLTVPAKLLDVYNLYKYCLYDLCVYFGWFLTRQSAATINVLFHHDNYEYYRYV